MDALSQQHMARAGRSRQLIQLKRVEAALKRFEEGRYGECCRCHEPIPSQRLAADPATPFCMDCLQEINA